LEPKGTGERFTARNQYEEKIKEQLQLKALPLEGVRRSLHDHTAFTVAAYKEMKTHEFLEAVEWQHRLLVGYGCDWPEGNLLKLALQTTGNQMKDRRIAVKLTGAGAGGSLVWMYDVGESADEVTHARSALERGLKRYSEWTRETLRPCWFSLDSQETGTLLACGRDEASRKKLALAELTYIDVNTYRVHSTQWSGPIKNRILISNYERHRKELHRIYFEKYGTGVRVWLGDRELWKRTGRHDCENRRAYLLQALMETVIHGQMENSLRCLSWDKSQ
jgi:hypothetical protein